MFGKLSRYRKLPDVTVPDARGRLLSVKDLRLLPPVSGTFRHTVAAGDRLDQLAYTYYGEPRLYWQVCDANPQFLSPFAVLADEPVVTTRFALPSPVVDPPWAKLFAALDGVVGVVAVESLDEVELVPRVQRVDGQVVTVYVERFVRAVRITHNTMNVTAESLRAAIGTSGFQAGPPVDGGQLGREIVVPARVVG
jgi:hypothetical protein